MSEARIDGRESAIAAWAMIPWLIGGVGGERGEERRQLVVVDSRGSQRVICSCVVRIAF